MLKGHRDLKVYQLAYKLAMEIFHLSRAFHREEIYSLTTRSVVRRAALPRIWLRVSRKRRYPAMLLNKLADCDAEGAETQVWIDFAYDCGYLSKENHRKLTSGYEQFGRMLGSMMATPEKFAPR